MYKVVQIGEKKVPMLANAATPIRFKQLFKKDLLRILIHNTDVDEKRRRLLDEKAKEFREQHTPEEVKRLIEERKNDLDRQIAVQEKATGQKIELDEVKRYTNAVDSLAQDLMSQEQLDEFEQEIYASYELANKVAYVMAAQAAAKAPSDLSKLSIDGFYEWLEGFEPHEIEASADEIMAVYNGTAEKDPDIELKKRDERSTETITRPYLPSE